jgi:PAS domain S-box-containing protein
VARSRLRHGSEGLGGAFRRLLEHAAEAVFLLDERGAVTYANQAATRLLGFSGAELSRQTPFAFVHPDDVPRAHDLLDELRLRWERPVAASVRCRHRDGGYRQVDMIGVNRQRDPEVGAIVAHARDVTARESVRFGLDRPDDRARALADAEEALRRTQQEFRDIFELASVGIFRSSREGRVLLANPALARLLGYETPEELAALDLAQDVYVNPAERDALIAQFERAAGPWTIEIQWKRRDGAPFWVLLSGHTIKGDGDRALYFEAFVQDITERRRSQQELKQSRGRLQALAARLEEVREQERKVMAREIHDELGQGLTALRMDLAWLAGRLPAKARDLTARARRMVKVIDQTIDTVRRLATQLRPPVLDDLGLTAAIEWQTEDTARRLGLRCTLDLPADLHLPEGLGTTVFRILQEALTNVARHASASRLRVALHVQRDQLSLEIVDDGRGIAAAHLDNRRTLGLLGMRERAMAWGGVLDIHSPPEGGTVVTLRLPLPGSAQERDAP